MNLSGLAKLTLLDYPGHTACTVFTGGCNFRCPFCHNATLVRGSADDLEFSEEELFKFLGSRKRLLDGVAVTGGEPLLHPETPELLRKIKDLGFAVKLDTNGSFPEVLEKVIGSGCVDYVAVDIKSSPARYDRVCGREGMFEKVSRTIALLLAGKVDYEFRTTVVSGLHEVEDFPELGKAIAGAKSYFLQNFKETDDLLEPWSTFASVDRATLDKMLAAVRPFVPAAALRGE